YFNTAQPFIPGIAGIEYHAVKIPMRKFRLEIETRVLNTHIGNRHLHLYRPIGGSGKTHIGTGGRAFNLRNIFKYLSFLPPAQSLERLVELRNEVYCDGFRPTDR